MNELKPCPFCGGKAVFQTKGKGIGVSDLYVDYIITCSVCGATPIDKPKRISVFLDANGNLVPSAVSEANKELAIEKWNERKEEE